MAAKKRIPKPRKHYIIYKTTNLINNKYYIGMHCTDNLEDGYLGSGKILKSSVKKYGIKCFKREILEFLTDFESLIIREEQLITKEVLKDPLCMNICVGGGYGIPWKGGFTTEQQKQNAIKSNKKQWTIYCKDENWFKKRGEKITKRLKLAYEEGRHPGWKKDIWIGRNHKKETKEKMSLSQKGKHDAEKKSQYGTCWIRNDKLKINKKIKKSEINFFINNDWIKGRKFYK